MEELQGRRAGQRELVGDEGGEVGEVRSFPTGQLYSPRRLHFLGGLGTKHLKHLKKNIHLGHTGQVFDLESLSVREEHLLSSENLGRICCHYDDIIFLVFVCQHPLYLFANIQ